MDNINQSSEEVLHTANPSKVSNTITKLAVETIDDLQSIESYLQYAPLGWQEIFSKLDSKIQLILSKNIQFLSDRVKVRMKCKTKDGETKEGIVSIDNKPFSLPEEKLIPGLIQNKDGVTYFSFEGVKQENIIPETLRLDGFVLGSIAKMMPAKDYELGRSNIASYQLYTMLGGQYEGGFKPHQGELKHEKGGEYIIPDDNYPVVDVQTGYIMTSSYSKTTNKPFVLSAQTDNDGVDRGSLDVTDPLFQAPTFILKEPIQFL